MPKDAEERLTRDVFYSLVYCIMRRIKQSECYSGKWFISAIKIPRRIGLRLVQFYIAKDLLAYVGNEFLIQLWSTSLKCLQYCLYGLRMQYKLQDVNFSWYSYATVDHPY